MITAVDSPVLIDIFEPDPTFGPRSREALREAIADGSVVACELVWAEVAATFPRAADAEQAMHQLGIEFSAVGVAAAMAAGEAWRSYRRGGGPRTRLIADFLVGAHAKQQPTDSSPAIAASTGPTSKTCASWIRRERAKSSEASSRLFSER